MLRWSANRESAAFAAVLWFFAHAWRGRFAVAVPEALFAAALSITGLIATVLLRGWFAPNLPLDAQAQGIGARLRDDLHAVKLVLAHPTPYAWPALGTACLALPAAVFALRWSRYEMPARRLALAAVATGVVSLAFANINELRAFDPMLAMFCFAAAYLKAREPA